MAREIIGLISNCSRGPAMFIIVFFCRVKISAKKVYFGSASKKFTDCFRRAMLQESIVFEFLLTKSVR